MSGDGTAVQTALLLLVALSSLLVSVSTLSCYKDVGLSEIYTTSEPYCWALISFDLRTGTYGKTMARGINDHYNFPIHNCTNIPIDENGDQCMATIYESEKVYGDGFLCCCSTDNCNSWTKSDMTERIAAKPGPVCTLMLESYKRNPGKWCIIVLLKDAIETNKTKIQYTPFTLQAIQEYVHEKDDILQFICGFSIKNQTCARLINIIREKDKEKASSTRIRDLVVCCCENESCMKLDQEHSLENVQCRFPANSHKNLDRIFDTFNLTELVSTGTEEKTQECAVKVVAQIKHGTFDIEISDSEFMGINADQITKACWKEMNKICQIYQPTCPFTNLNSNTSSVTAKVVCCCKGPFCNLQMWSEGTKWRGLSARIKGILNEACRLQPCYYDILPDRNTYEQIMDHCHKSFLMDVDISSGKQQDPAELMAFGSFSWNENLCAKDHYTLGRINPKTDQEYWCKMGSIELTNHEQDSCQQSESKATMFICCCDVWHFDNTTYYCNNWNITAELDAYMGRDATTVTRCFQGKSNASVNGNYANELHHNIMTEVPIMYRPKIGFPPICADVFLLNTSSNKNTSTWYRTAIGPLNEDKCKNLKEGKQIGCFINGNETVCCCWTTKKPCNNEQLNARAFHINSTKQLRLKDQNPFARIVSQHGIHCHTGCYHVAIFQSSTNFTDQHGCLEAMNHTKFGFGSLKAIISEKEDGCYAIHRSPIAEKQLNGSEQMTVVCVCLTSRSCVAAEMDAAKKGAALIVFRQHYVNGTTKVGSSSHRIESTVITLICLILLSV